MTSRFILFTSAAALLVACDRPNTTVDAGRQAELERQREAEQVANDRIRQLEDRLSEADQKQAAEREAELARAKEELEKLRAEATADPVEEGTAMQASDDRYAEEEAEPAEEGRVVPETQRVASVETFYDQLEDEGEWLESDDYGYVFQPRIASSNREWRPYTDGRWVYTDYGWTWQSNEDHGWATYHYGRWARVSGAGWVWVPGKEWAPAWVSWRRGGDHCGWAPLPPESRTRVSFSATVDRDYDLGPAAYVFVSLKNFGARSYAPVIERQEQNVTIINKTVNITNITYNQRGSDAVVFNGGPRYDTIRGRSQQPVERVNVNFGQRNTTVNNTTVNKTVNNTNINKTKIVNVQQGDTLQVAAPPAANARANAAPTRVRQKLGKVKRETGWEGVDSAQAQQVKTGMDASSKERKNRPRRANAPAPATVAAPAKPAPVVATPQPEPARPAATPVAAEKMPAPQPEPVAPAPAAAKPERRRVVEPPTEQPPAAEQRPARPALPTVDPTPKRQPVEAVEQPANPRPPKPAPIPPAPEPKARPAAPPEAAPQPKRQPAEPQPQPGSGRPNVPAGGREPRAQTPPDNAAQPGTGRPNGPAGGREPRAQTPPDNAVQPTQREGKPERSGPKPGGAQGAPGARDRRQSSACE